MRNQKYLKNFNPQQIIKLNISGLNLKEISKIVDIPERRLGELCKQYNLDVKRRFKYLINDNFFDNLDSESKFYLLGYFIADGCLQLEEKFKNNKKYSESYRFMLNVSIDDEDVIKLFQKNISPNKPLEYSNNQNGVKSRKKQVHLRWSSKHMFDTLGKYNIKPRKTYDNYFLLPKNIVHHNLFKHLIRGLIDGDGYIGKGHIQICLNSKYFAKQILYNFKTYKYLTKYNLKEIQGKTCKYYSLTLYGGKKFIEEYFTNNINCKYYLKRKYYNPVLTL